MSKISVVVPVYNGEKYINRCIQSLVEQTLNDIEIILVDDGSTDATPQICDNYANKDARIKVIHIPNSGMGKAYNTGMDAASGNYIGFVESDDVADIHMLEDLYSLSEKHNFPDIVKSAWMNYYIKDDYAEKDLQMASFNSYDKFNIKQHPWLLQKQASVWSAIYRKDFIKDKNIRYLETPGASYQDVAFTFKVLALSDSMVITPDAYIYYTKDNENSSVNSKEKSEVIFWEYEEVDKFFEENPEIKKWANINKLFKQFYDYNWNYNRITPELKSNFIKRFASDFKKYRDKNELTEYFYSNIDRIFLEDIMRFV